MECHNFQAYPRHFCGITLRLITLRIIYAHLYTNILGRFWINYIWCKVVVVLYANTEVIRSKAYRVVFNTILVKENNVSFVQYLKYRKKMCCYRLSNVKCYQMRVFYCWRPPDWSKLTLFDHGVWSWSWNSFILHPTGRQWEQCGPRHSKMEYNMLYESKFGNKHYIVCPL